jgi:hypothetical protein
MNVTRNPDSVVAAWLDEGPAELPIDTRRAISAGIRTARRRRAGVGLPLGGQLRWPDVGLSRAALALGGVAAIVIAAAVTVNLYGNLVGLGGPGTDPRTPFLGTWISTSDADGGMQTMTVERADNNTVEIVVTDTIATVCSFTPSTMTGTGTIDGSNLVIPTPDYRCDDGSEPQTSSGPPLDEVLRNLTYVRDPARDVLAIGDGMWHRLGAVDATPEPTAEGTTSGGMWPQSTLEEVRAAQDRADAGDPEYTWQVDPNLAAWPDSNTEDPLEEAEIFQRFIREVLGWEEFSGFAIGGYVPEGGHSHHLASVVFIRCEPGRTNPLYPKAYPDMPPQVRTCAPTIDDSRWETVRFDVEQEGRTGPTGVWVVTQWELGDPTSASDDFVWEGQVKQAVPPSDSEVNALLRAFLGAREDGQGAEEYLHPAEADEPASPDEEVPLLYATTGGSPYERSEIKRVQGPEWPTGSFEVQVRLFAEDGTTVEQIFAVVGQEDGRLGLMYGSPTEPIPTTENGQAVPVPYSILDGEVTFAAAPPWSDTILEPTHAVLGGVGRGSAMQFTMFAVIADPGTGIGCDSGPAAADAEALVRSIRSNPDFEATAPVAVSVGGSDALQMDVVAAPGARGCGPLWSVVGQDSPTRLYLLDLPDGMSARILAIAISALESEFEYVVRAATPVLGSFEFHTP